VEVLRRFWQCLDTGLLWTISNWLWAGVVNPTVSGLRQLKLRQIALLAAFLVIVWAIADGNPLGLHLARAAAMIAGDTVLYAEFVSFAVFAVARGQAHRLLVPVARMAGFALRRAGQAVARAAARTKRPLRLPRLLDSEDSGDVPDGPFVFA
jgi:hypothetical protein